MKTFWLGAAAAAALAIAAQPAAAFDRAHAGLLEAETAGGGGGGPQLSEAPRMGTWGFDHQSSFAGLLSELGDKRELKTILRSIQRMANADARVSGEMQVILTLLQRDESRARRIAQATQWAECDNGSMTADIQGVRLTLHPQSRGRWSIHARDVAEGPDGYSPSVPHWRSSLEAAKIRAVLAVDETLDHIERIKAERDEGA